MYLTRMALNKARRGAARLLASPQMMHAAVLSSYPPDTVLDSPEGRVLWRVDVDGPHTHLYVVSPERPDLTALVEQAGWPLTSTWETKEYTPLLDRVRKGDEFRFSLVANPVHDVRQASGKSKRLPHVTAAQQEAWLSSKGQRSGFEIPTTRVVNLGDDGEEVASDVPFVTVSDRRDRRFRRGEGTVTLRTARFDGILRVTDAEAFRLTLGHGVGPAKGYGCGLLTVSRPSARPVQVQAG